MLIPYGLSRRATPLALLGLLACTGKQTDDTAGPADGPSECQDDLQPGELAPMAEDFADGSEGVAFSGGALYVSDTNGIARYTPDAGWTRTTPLDQALGLAPAGFGVLVADPGPAFTFDGTGTDGRLLQVSGEGITTVLAEGMPNPNFVLAKPDGGVLVSDDTAAIYEVRGGAFTTWLDTVPSPNGMGLTRDGSALYVVSTFEPEPPLWRVPLEGGVPGTPEVVTTFETGSAPDGLAIDAQGGVWVALNLANELVRIDPATGEETDRILGVTTPASLAFGAGEGFDPCSLYVTELYGETVWRVATGRRGLSVLAANLAAE